MCLCLYLRTRACACVCMYVYVYAYVYVCVCVAFGVNSIKGNSYLLLPKWSKWMNCGFWVNKNTPKQHALQQFWSGPKSMRLVSYLDNNLRIKLFVFPEHEYFGRFPGPHQRSAGPLHSPRETLLWRHQTVRQCVGNCYHCSDRHRHPDGLRRLQVPRDTERTGEPVHGWWRIPIIK